MPAGFTTKENWCSQGLAMKQQAYGIWKVPIHPHQIEHTSHQLNHLEAQHTYPSIVGHHSALNMYTLPFKQQQLKYMHQAFFSPPVSTLIKAINNNQLRGIPMMKADLVQTYLAPSPATSKGHMKRPRTGICSTRWTTTAPSPTSAPVTPCSHIPDDTPTRPPAMTPHIIQPDTTDTSCNVFCYAALANKHQGTMYTDATGALPAVTLEGNQYYFVAYAYNQNIYATPLRNL
eukprot:CCRYP_015590-RA/>CCRYP_015590-RA protein AED:0.59 eAED:0.59 QI:0/-1/0/1/-1/1/1/0/231